MTFEEARIATIKHELELFEKAFDSMNKSKVVDEVKRKICNNIMCKLCIMNEENKCHGELDQLNKDELKYLIDWSGVKIKSKKYLD